jgi:rubrerythrin
VENTEQQRILDAIVIAIEMERDGKECYEAASKESANDAGRAFLQSLAEEEDNHQLKFQQIYNSLQQNRGWPSIALDNRKIETIKKDLISTCTVLGVNVTGSASELDAVKVAVDKERKSFDFYNSQAQRAAYDSEREFYHALAQEEREHELALLNYLDYLSDPADWFLKAEHASLDGG